MVWHPTPVDLASISGDGGVVWSSSPGGVHVNLVVLAAGDAIGRHRNDDVDVLIIVLGGDASVGLDNGTHRLASGHALLIPHGAERDVVGGPDGARYLTIHRARGGLSIRGSVPGGARAPHAERPQPSQTINQGRHAP
jgi:quercetin dioxygenase-like cupin family protein